MFLQLQHLTKSFAHTRVISDLSLDVDAGELVCLLGASGCGKTTTLRMIGGFLKPDAGRIVLDGQDVTALSPEVRPTATVFQSYALFPHMSVAQNVAYGLMHMDKARAQALGAADKNERMQLVAQMLERVGLAECANQRVTSLSGGQRQRVALARALIVKPKLMLLDEPFSNLDANLRIKMRSELKRIQEHFGCTMLFVTHDTEEALFLADRVALMHDGTFEQVGAPQELYLEPKSACVAKFFGPLCTLVLEGGVCHFRPEDVVLGGAGPYLARVVDAHFLGGTTQYRLELVGDAGAGAHAQGVAAPVAAEPAQSFEARSSSHDRYAKGTVLPFDIVRTLTW